MEPKEFESLLNGGNETQGIDYKESCVWNVKSYAKDILAMSNIDNGGFIIIGVKENKDGFERIGVSDDHIRSYDFDVMKDQMSGYADPWVNFNVITYSDKEENKYVFIRVFEFEEVPIICKKDCIETKQNIIYYRNRNRRWESAPVSNTSDLRDLLERATVKMMKKIYKLGLKISSDKPEISSEKSKSKEMYDEEKKDFNE